MSEQTPEQDASQDTGQDGTGISDEQLPDDLVPGEDNPLAEGLDDGETAGDLLEEGKPAEQWEGDEPDGTSSEDHSTDGS